MIEIGQVLYHKDWPKVTPAENIELDKPLLVATVNSYIVHGDQMELGSYRILKGANSKVNKRHFGAARTAVTV